MKNNFSNMSMLNKFTLAYILLVFIPVVLISSYSYYQAHLFYEKELIEESKKYLKYLKDDITQKIDIIREISENIAYNSTVYSFLKREFNFNQFGYEVYRQEIYTIVDYAMIYDKLNIHMIRIFMCNETIPEGWGYFFSDRRLHEKDWYTNFIESEDRETWLRLKGSEYFQHVNLSNAKDKEQFVFFRKILDYDGTVLGILAVEIFDEDIFTPFFYTVSSDNYNSFILYNNRILHESTDMQNYFTIDQITKNLDLEKDYFRNDENILINDTIDSLGVKFGVVTSLSSIDKLISSLNINLILINVATLILVVIFYFTINTFFYNIRQCMETMTKAVQGDFSIRIPVRKRNEIGIIAQDFNFMIQKVNELIHEVVRKETAQKEAQLNALQYQINPHFFYNTLDILAGRMILLGNYEIAEGIADFGKILRYNLSSSSRFSTFLEESEHIRNYIMLQKVKYGDKLSLSINLPDNLKNYRILKFTLQPIVENSIIHGLVDQNSLQITIDFVAKDEDRVEIMVTDNGIGISKQELHRMNISFENSVYDNEPQGNDGSIGLRNINERLKLFYGKEFFIRLDSVEGLHTRVALLIPQIGEGSE
ncbi:MAG TPA: histidine kinase [Gallicola sp.]|jgi:two-component system sensor histidine kinase YesM|nr:histidine kinase [Gallicola sp.]